MGFIITLAGTTTQVEGTESVTEETLEQWLEENQVYYTSESVDLPSSGDLTKYIVYRTDEE